jgi:hypothetical protein
MSERSTVTTVTFQNPFTLSDLEGPQPAGTYTVETVDTPLDNLSFLAWRRISTLIMVPPIDVATLQRQMILIDPLELDTALKRDAEVQPSPAIAQASGAKALER